MSFLRGFAVLTLVGGCGSQLSSRPSVPYGGRTVAPSLQFAQEAIAAASGAPGETPAASGETMTMAYAYKLALRVNEPVMLAELGIRSAEIALHDRNTDMKPSIGITGTGRLQSESLFGPQPNRLAVASLDVSQPLFRKGFFASRQAGRHGIESAEAAMKRAKEQLARDVATVYVNAVRARKLRDNAQAAVTRAKSIAERMAVMKKAGGALPTAEQLAQLDLKRAERQAVDAERDVGVADVFFKRLIGVAPPDDLQLEEPTIPAVAAGLELVKGRSDIKVLDLSVQQARADEEAAAGDRWWPRLDIGGSLQAGYARFDDTGATNQNPITWSVSAVVTIPIFQRGIENVAIERAQNQTRLAQRSLELQAKLASEEAQAAVARLEASTRSVELADLQLKTATEHFELINKQFRAGAITFLEVTNAQQVIVEAENAALTSKMDRTAAIYDYLFAIGALDLSKTE